MFSKNVSLNEIASPVIAIMRILENKDNYKDKFFFLILFQYYSPVAILDNLILN